MANNGKNDGSNNSLDQHRFHHLAGRQGRAPMYGASKFTQWRTNAQQ